MVILLPPDALRVATDPAKSNQSIVPSAVKSYDAPVLFETDMASDPTAPAVNDPAMLADVWTAPDNDAATATGTPTNGASPVEPLAKILYGLLCSASAWTAPSGVTPPRVVGTSGP